MAARMVVFWNRLYKLSCNITCNPRINQDVVACDLCSKWHCTSTASSTHPHPVESPRSQASSPADRSHIQSDEREFYVPVAASSAEHEFLLLAKPSSQPRDSRVLKVAIVGTPNAGKSTLINKLLGRRICAVSRKVHTTRRNALAVVTRKNAQLVLLDTPGLISYTQGRRHKLPRSLLVDAKNTLLEADMIAVLVDASNKWTNTKLDPELLVQLHSHPTLPSVLVLNKVDALPSKQSLFEITEALTEGIVDGEEFVSRKQKRRSSDESQKLRNSLQGANGGHTAERCRDELLEGRNEGGGLSEHWDNISGRDARLRPCSRAGDNDDGEKVAKEDDGVVPKGTEKDNVPTQIEISAQNHDRVSKASPHAEMVGTDDLRRERAPGASIGDCGAPPQADGQASKGQGPGGPEMDAAKRDTLKEYSSNLMQFIGADDEATARVHEEDADAVAKRREEDRRARRVEMERQREEKRLLWRMAKERVGWSGFSRVFMISALTGDGVSDLKEFLTNSARKGDWEYHEDVVTNLSPGEILNDAIREKLMETLPQEVPYNISQTTEVWQTGANGELDIVQTVICKKKSHLKMLEKKVGWIARRARQDLMDAFHCEVKLRVHLKLKK